jgi:hypothetical protein
MDAPTAPEQYAIVPHLPPDVCDQLVYTLRAVLPAPVSNTPEDAARRDNAAIAHIACLLPANAEETDIAAQYVVAKAQAMDCLRLARAYPNDTAHALKCTAQAASMMRQARSWRSLLTRIQADRQKAGKQPAAAEPADAVPSLSPEPKHATASQSSPIVEAERYALQHRKRAELIRRLGGLPQKLNFGPISSEVVRAIATADTPILRSLDKAARHTA